MENLEIENNFLMGKIARLEHEVNTFQTVEELTDEVECIKIGLDDLQERNYAFKKKF